MTYYKIERIIPSLLSCLLLCVTSCTSDTPNDLNSTKGDEMILTVGEISRSAVTTSIGSFAIYGDMMFKSRTIIFDNTPVKYIGNNQWTYGQTQYWFPKHEYSFIAIHPTDAAGISGTEYSDSRLSFTYTLPDSYPNNYKSIQDLMLATHRRHYEEDLSTPNTPVTLRFNHILSRINFQVTNANAADIVRVTKIVLEGINKTGSFNITPASLSSGSEQTDDYNSSWTDISNNGTLNADIRVDIPETEKRSLFPDDNALFIVPQPDNKSVIVHITYTLIDTGVDNVELTLTAETPIGGWEPGNIYTYSLEIEEISKEIYLTVSVKPWQTPQGAVITVPES